MTLLLCHYRRACWHFFLTGTPGHVCQHTGVHPGICTAGFAGRAVWPLAGLIVCGKHPNHMALSSLCWLKYLARDKACLEGRSHIMPLCNEGAGVGARGEFWFWDLHLESCFLFVPSFLSPLALEDTVYWSLLPCVLKGLVCAFYTDLEYWKR